MSQSGVGAAAAAGGPSTVSGVDGSNSSSSVVTPVKKAPIELIAANMDAIEAAFEMVTAIKKSQGFSGESVTVTAGNDIKRPQDITENDHVRASVLDNEVLVTVLSTSTAQEIAVELLQMNITKASEAVSSSSSSGPTFINAKEAQQLVAAQLSKAGGGDDVDLSASVSGDSSVSGKGKSSAG